MAMPWSSAPRDSLLFICSTTLSEASLLLKYLTITFAPLAAYSFELAAPRSRIPPVTSAVLPANEPGSLLLINHAS